MSTIKKHIALACILLAIHTEAKLTEPLDVLNPSPAKCAGYTEHGTFVQLEVLFCRSPPCAFTSAMYYDTAMSFKISTVSNNMRLKIYFVPSGTTTKTTLVDASQPGTFNPNRLYKASVQMLIPTTLRGKQGNVEVVVLDNVRTYVHRCFAATVAQ